MLCFHMTGQRLKGPPALKADAGTAPGFQALQFLSLIHHVIRQLLVAISQSPDAIPFFGEGVLGFFGPDSILGFTAVVEPGMTIGAIPGLAIFLALFGELVGQAIDNAAAVALLAFDTNLDDGYRTRERCFSHDSPKFSGEGRAVVSRPL